MRKVLIVLAIVLGLVLATKGDAHAARVGGYYRSNGSYVQPHYRSNPNSFKFDNYSSRGNYNPYTGSKGYRRW